MRRFAILILPLLLCAVSLWATAGKWPWQRRIGRNVEIAHKLQHQRVTPQMWPEEPASPQEIVSTQFETALGTLCGQMPPDRLEKYASAVLRESSAFQVDPFLVGALVYDQSGCLPKTPDNSLRYGLTRIDVAMHAPHIRDGAYNYWVQESGSWVPRSLKADKFPFNIWKAAKWDSNIYWTAAILRVFQSQHDSLDRAFPERPHRHYVSHWFFGDNVLEIEPEDRILTVRRRLIAYYNGTGPAPAGQFAGIDILSPLDGVPRLVLDDFGNKRGTKGKPGHQGMDLVAPQGEPIRAMAAGRVVFAGVDLPTSGQSKELTPSEAEAFPEKAMGKGGLYVAINHGEGFRTYYMHMDSIAVKHWDDVQAGQIIGTVGRTGAAQSGSHLHLEFRINEDRADPALSMQRVLVDPKTLTIRDN